MNAIWKVCICVGFCALAGQAVAAPTVVDFNAQGYTDNQVLPSTVFGLATLTSEVDPLSYDLANSGLVGNLGASADIGILFSAPVYNVAVTAGDSGGDEDRFALSLFAFGTDAPLGTFVTPFFNGGGPLTATLNPLVGNVGRVVFDPGNAGALPGLSTANPGLGVALGVLSYEICDGPEPPNGVIPAPGALMLCAFGTTIVTWLRSRKMV